MSLPRFSRRGIAMPLLALFFALDMHGTAAVTWTGDTGNWSNTALWNPKTAPVNSSSSTQTITFGGEGGTAYTATQNIATPLYLGVLVLESSASVTETIAGNSLQIQGGGVASILQNGSGDFLIRNNIVMGNSVNFSGTGSGTVTLAGVISGAAVPKLNLSNTGDAALILTGANTYSAGTNVSAGTLLVNNTSGSGTGSAAVAVAASGAKNAFLGGFERHKRPQIDRHHFRHVILLCRRSSRIAETHHHTRHQSRAQTAAG